MNTCTIASLAVLGCKLNSKLFYSLISLLYLNIIALKDMT